MSAAVIARQRCWVSRGSMVRMSSDALQLQFSAVILPDFTDHSLQELF